MGSSGIRKARFLLSADTAAMRVRGYRHGLAVALPLAANDKAAR
ncbi:hypothetical protein [Vogesella sp. LIG4]|nr:hypothetical protein [Vogesella sp. LIG4]SCK18621.1 hypothetical protein PSELUDRAFT_2023 [Vogesella sp. LIG4]